MEISKFLFKKEYIKNILKDKHDKKNSTGYLFYGPDDQTNSIVLKFISKLMVCEENGDDDCPHCVKIEQNCHPDVLVYPKGNSFAVADSKDIIEQANKKPMLCSIKVIVINNFDISSPESQNKLLKTLEEPPKNVIFLASASNMNNVLATIKSRLVKIEIPPFDKKEIEEIFAEYSQKPEFELAIQNGNGYIGITKNILFDAKYLENYNICTQIITKLKSSAQVVDYIDKKLDRTNLSVILQNLQNMYRDIMVLKSKKNELVLNQHLINDLEIIKDEYSMSALTQIIKNINNANKKLTSNVSPSLILETLLVKNLEVKFLCK